MDSENYDEQPPYGSREQLEHPVGELPSVPLVTTPFLGVQSVWSTEMAFASPYLISLGLPKSLTACTFLAGPLSGLLIQPLMGSYADASRSRYGRRRPFMLGGSAICAAAMLLLGFSKPLGSLFFGQTATGNTITIILAVVALYVIDFSINAGNDGSGPGTHSRCATLYAPRPRQRLGEPNDRYWKHSGILHVGPSLPTRLNLPRLHSGNLHLPNILPFLGSTQLEIVSVIATSILIGTHILAIVSIKERPLTGPVKAQQTVLSTFTNVFLHFRQLSKVVRTVCLIKFWSSQFVTTFFATVYISDIYNKQYPDQSLSTPPKHLSTDDAIRAGSYALFLGAIATLVATIVVPWLQKKFMRRGRSGLITSSSAASLAFVWACSNALYSVLNFLSGASKSVGFATAIIALMGTCVGVDHWAPYALIGEALLVESRTHPSAPQSGSGTPDTDLDVTETLLEGQGNSSSAVKSSDAAASAGVVLGIYNIFVVLPQFLFIALSAIIFQIMEPNRDVIHPGPSSVPSTDEAKPEGGPSAIVVIFWFAGLSSLIATYYSLKLMMYLRKHPLD
ncbi:uncharacterized protein EI90DRAFT_3155165 [Cantharellus anzutake]|uniref:uncharacterized protein n=1 Tax=Cantharellus anzutake TaxID=1750568 RepID=UPI001902F5C2|nr:uncharacterized protein EI90DRAFT_3155165 [Cantharellus anzutake]KAF8329729.1 hypothetical protein EI90DRAFT_3155165 [Cantharellus anzutake]